MFSVPALFAVGEYSPAGSAISFVVLFEPLSVYNAVELLRDVTTNRPVVVADPIPRTASTANTLTLLPRTVSNTSL